MIQCAKKKFKHEGFLKHNHNKVNSSAVLTIDTFYIFFSKTLKAVIVYITTDSSTKVDYLIHLS